MVLRLERFGTALAALLAGCWGALVAASHSQGDISLLDRFEAPLTDMRFLLHGERVAPDLVTVVAIDDATVQQAGAYPLPRATLARVVERLAASRPKAIAVDLLLVEPGVVEADQAVIDALRRAPTVLAAAGSFEGALQGARGDGANRLEGVPIAKDLLLPHPRFSEVSIGTVNVATDRAGTPRHVPLLLRTGDRLAMSLPLRAVSLALRDDPVLEPDAIVLGERKIATDVGYSLPLRFYGPRGTVRTISAARVLGGEAAQELFVDRLVFVGATVKGGGDFFPTPFDSVLPGVEVLATAAAHLLTGDALLRDWRVRAVDTAVAVSLPFLLVLLLAWHRTAAALSLIGLVMMLWVALTAAAFMYGIWLSAALPFVAAVPPAVVFGSLRLRADRARADVLARESGTLRRFQPRSLADRLSRDPDFLIVPIQQQAAVVFVDLSGFTGLSESLGPDQTRSLLKGFHSLVDQQAGDSNGLVASFMGDGAMMIFGLPDSGDKDACHAVEACVGLCSSLTTWLASLPPPVSSGLGFKIGAHFGTVVASRLGGGSHEHIAATGDTVNVASRLMGVAAAYGAELALSESLYAAAGQACKVFETGTLNRNINVPIRGRAGALAVWLWRSNSSQSTPA